jgi:hypothetical protein
LLPIPPVLLFAFSGCYLPNSSTTLGFNYIEKSFQGSRFRKEGQLTHTAVDLGVKGFKIDDCFDQGLPE